MAPPLDVEFLQQYAHHPLVSALLAEHALIEPHEPVYEKLQDVATGQDLWQGLCKAWRQGRQEGFVKALHATAKSLCGRRHREPRMLSDFIVHRTLPLLTAADAGRLQAVAGGSLREALSPPKHLQVIMTSRGMDTSRLKCLAHVHLEEETQHAENIIAFNFSNTYVHDRFKSLLIRFAKLAKRHRGAKITLESHIEPSNADDLSAIHTSGMRGSAVSYELQSLGLAASRIEVQSCCKLPAIHRTRFVREHRRVDIFLEVDGLRFPDEKQEPSATMLETMTR
eukprot:TRINITY_DN23863_c0_g2_i1.p1 TRINITY_DN23863_c0_g2~~TRINITY_DN23863_c0_g2_i1.p1  ORF type:complete len:282 (+),score=41.76 TRINITY_DN23863_c0_g2_i1:151-996(+)